MNQIASIFIYNANKYFFGINKKHFLVSDIVPQLPDNGQVCLLHIHSKWSQVLCRRLQNKFRADVVGLYENFLLSFVCSEVYWCM